MDELLALEEGMVVFEVGAGSGYQAATLAEIVSPGGPTARGGGRVYTSEIIPSLAKRARANLMKAGYADRVHVLACDGSGGLPISRRPDRILITAAAPAPPPPLLRQLRPGGRMVLPVGSHSWWGGQRLVVVRKLDEGSYETAEITDVAFVPMRGRFGWR